ncbi:sensor histidine kinase [Zwartia panacis]|uniref:sensor histidine kinase n=1 Tax=Zwartia panacis TaxID=2683345 RepID=UPI0025B50642|nr:sensor histidine kinase [Zwartia panacis]MDN4018176.1 sensor histidine kinase N-terminal domain-containing protein [Zwartia panacis]
MSITHPKRLLLRTQLLRWLLYPLLLLLALDSAIGFVLADRFSRDAYDKALIEIAHELSLQVRTNDAGIYLDLPEVARRLLLQDPQDKIFFELSSKSGEVISGQALPKPNHPPLVVRGNIEIYDSHVNGDEVRIVQLPKREPDGSILRVAETYVKRKEMARDIITIVVLPQILLIILVGILVRLGVTKGLLPLKNLQRSIALRSHRDRSPLDESTVPGEVIPLVTSINALLQRLDDVLVSQSRFIADAAHQLKTPVSALNAYVELLARSKSPSERESIILQLNRAVERMSRLVSQLLVLAENDITQTRPIELQKINLNDLVLDISTSWVPQALKNNIDLGFEACAHPVHVYGDLNRLQDLFDNLIDNAIRYSPPKGRVTIRILAAPLPTVTISDDARMILEDEKKLIFERFHRLLGIGDGSGLGLAIAKEIAVAHQATISIQPDHIDGKGNVFSIVFPADASTNGK